MIVSQYEKWIVDSKLDDIFTGIFKIHIAYHNIYTVHIRYVDDFSKLKWTIERVSETNDTTVTIKSNKGEYLCASHLSHDIFRQRKRIYLKNIYKNMFFKKIIHKNCEWRLEKVDGAQTFMILSETFMEPIYAPSFFYKCNFLQRNVYLWKNKPSSIGSEFKWSIDCGKGVFLLE